MTLTTGSDGFEPDDSEDRQAAEARCAAACALADLEQHSKTFGGLCMKDGTFASSEWDRLYAVWIQARWDAADTWVRSVWPARPEGDHV